MVRKQNEWTLLLQSRIIPLSLHPIFHILAPLAPFPQDWGLSFSPETFSHKFFPKFFSTKARWLFSTFLVRKIMRVEGTCRSANRGGVPFCRLSPYSNRHTLTPGTPASSGTHNVKSASKQGETGQKLIFICSVLSRPRNLGDNKGQKPNIFLKCGCKVVGVRVCLLACLLVEGVQALWCYFADVSKNGQDTARCSAFYSLCRSSLGASLANMALFRVFRGF